MLSQSTLEFLAEIQQKSHAVYSDGGMLYTYVEAANAAHFRFPEDRSAERSTSLSPADLNEFSRFLQAVHGDYLAVVPDISFVDLSGELLALLQRDLEFDDLSLSIDDCGHDGTAIVSMARRSDNRYFSLELFWSID